MTVYFSFSLFFNLLIQNDKRATDFGSKRQNNILRESVIKIDINLDTKKEIKRKRLTFAPQEIFTFCKFNIYLHYVLNVFFPRSSNAMFSLFYPN
jgi:hypothetical protein